MTFGRGRPLRPIGRMPLRILILHSRYLSGQMSGENRVVEDEERLLQTAGHDVRTWTPAPSDRKDAAEDSHSPFALFVWSDVGREPCGRGRRAALADGGS